MTKVNVYVPEIVKSYRLVTTGTAHHFGQYLARKVVGHYRILPVPVVSPPLLTLLTTTLTIYYRLLFWRSAVSYLYLGFFDLFS